MNISFLTRFHGAEYSTQPSIQYLRSDEGTKAVVSVIRQGGVDGRQVTGGVVRGEDLFWTIQTYGNQSNPNLTHCLTIIKASAPLAPAQVP